MFTAICLGITFGHERSQAADPSENIVETRLHQQFRLSSQDRSFDPIASPVCKNKYAVAIAGFITEVPEKWLGSVSFVDGYPHVDLIAAHSLGQDIVEFIRPDHVVDPPGFTGILCKARQNQRAYPHY